MKVADYRALVHLNEPYNPSDPASPVLKEQEKIVDDLLAYLKSEPGHPENRNDASTLHFSYSEKRGMLRSLLTVRGPGPLPAAFHEQLDGLLQREAQNRGIVEALSLPRIARNMPATSYRGADLCALWQGDITTLRIDAIVNAANAYLLGCFQPFHACIDNVIHNAAGPRLREDCHAIMGLQDGIEPAGKAKVTRGYNLPSKYVIHTVGPILKRGSQAPSPEQEQQLASCYISCLNLAEMVSNIRSIAFCCISTGVFAFPQEHAAGIALRTVEQWLDNHEKALDLIVFNVFRNDDLRIYERLLSGW